MEKVVSSALVTVAISTVGSNLAGIQLPSPRSEVCYLVLVQRPSLARAFPAKPRDDVLYVGLSSVGLSRSRNTALALVETPVMMLADDDLVLDVDSIVLAARDVLSQEVDFAIARMTQGFSRKVRVSWPLVRVPNVYDTGMFASCEILLNVSRMRSFGLAFDPNFGVGSGCYPAGEEGLYMLHAMRAGASGVFLPYVLCHHEELSSGFRYLGVEGAIGSLAFAQTLRPRRLPILRRLRYVLAKRFIPWRDKIRVVCAASPVVAPCFFKDMYDPGSLLYVGRGAVDGAAELLSGIVRS